MTTPQLPASAVWGSLVTGGFAAGGIPYIDPNNFPAVDLNNLFWDSTNKRLNIGAAGDNTGTDPVNAYAQHDQFQLQAVVPAGTPWNSALPAGFTTSSSRGTAAINAALQAADFVGGFFGWGYITTTPATPVYTPLAGIWTVVRGVDANGNLGGELHFGTKADGGVFADLGFLDAAGVFRPTVLEGMQLGKAAFGFAGLFLGFSNSGGVGAQVINKSSGRTGIAAGQTSIVVTNNKVTATSVVIPVLETNDATAKSVIAIPAGGSVTFTLNAAATGQVTVSFLVVGN